MKTSQLSEISLPFVDDDIILYTSLLKVNPIEIKYRIALKDEELKHATFASSFYGTIPLHVFRKTIRRIKP